jgi:hypothetical protein
VVVLGILANSGPRCVYSRPLIRYERQNRLLFRSKCEDRTNTRFGKVHAPTWMSDMTTRGPNTEPRRGLKAAE